MKLFPEDAADRFEFPKVIARIATISQSQKAKDFSGQLSPLDAPDAIQRLLSQTAEALEILLNGLYFPEYAFPNIQRELGLLAIDNAVLEGTEIIKLRKVAEVAASLIRFLSEKKQLYPQLQIIFDHLFTSKEIIALIDAVLEPNGFIKSNATRELADARKQLAEVRQRTNKAFEASVRKYKRLGWLREFDETFYGGRRVLAVVAEHKRQIEGTLHGSSETGSTAYIEPSNLVALNNEVAEALQREQREEYRILRKLTQDLKAYLDMLSSYEYALGFLDFTFAKAKYAREINAILPHISREKDIRLIDAYHPVLLQQNKQEGKLTKPLGLTLDSDKRILVISGPNAGGKSVSLKTFGLLQIMLQSGLLVPANADSRFGIFKQLFVDIGDDQSIAYELSTYSSRLIKMKHFLLHAHKHTLFFIDEFGTGSDPELGGAIAETILEELTGSRAMGVITTHYSNIKILAEEHPAIVNGCMLFDEATLQPKYELHIGHPGSSYTFEVAQKIGLDKRIIDAAKAKLDGRKVKLDQLLVTLQAKKNALNRETSILQQEKSKTRKEIDTYQRESEEFKRKQSDLNFEDNKRLIEKGKKYEALIEGWQEKRKRKELAHKITLISEREAAKKLSSDAAEILRAKQERIKEQRHLKKNRGVNGGQKERKPFAVGDEVRMLGSKEIGVVEEIHKDRITVVFGMMKTIVKSEKLDIA